MRSRSKWQNQILEMEPNDQLELAELLTNELSLNEIALDPEDGYNKESSLKIRKLLEEYINNAKEEKERQNWSDTLNNLVLLSEGNQERIIKVVYKTLLEIMKEEDKRKRELKCKQEGHTFSEWDEINWTTTEPVWDAGWQGTIEVQHTVWKRECSYCGLKEESKEEPLEVKQAREAAERKEEAKQLRKKLRDLKQQSY